MLKINNNRGSSSGNALIIVLIMIALLAALTLTITRMGSTTNTVSQEQAQVQASDILRRAKILENGVRQLMTVNGCSETQINFGATTGAPSDKHCDVFSIEGAGLSSSLLSAKKEWLDSTYSANGAYGNFRPVSAACHYKLGGDDTTSCKRELDMVLFFVSNSLCTALNKALDINSPTYAAILETVPPTNPFDGTFTNSTIPSSDDTVWGDGTATALSGKNAYCLYKTVSGTGNYFVYTLITR